MKFLKSTWECPSVSLQDIRLASSNPQHHHSREHLHGQEAVVTCGLTKAKTGPLNASEFTWTLFTHCTKECSGERHCNCCRRLSHYHE